MRLQVVSPFDGTGCNEFRPFDRLSRIRYDAFAGWSSLVARRAHNPKVVSSNLTPATNFSCSINYLEATAPVASFSFSVQSV